MKKVWKAFCGGIVVGVFVSYSEDVSSIPADLKAFLVIVLQKEEIVLKKAVSDPYFNKECLKNAPS